MKVSELARSAGVTAESVRHYVREGLLHPERHPDNGYQLTGTPTEGKPEVTESEVLEGDDREVLGLVAALEAESSISADSP